jgi:DEAD/DEAH box helicase domain-containing protein
MEQIIDRLKRDKNFMANVSAWKVLEPKEAEFSEFPKQLNKKLLNALQEHGIKQLYSHQANAISHSLKGDNTVIVTPTASGKTLCYNIPVLNSIVETEEARALYLFPTKALSQDQLNELHSLIDLVGGKISFDIKSYTFDGDTPVSARKAIKSSGHIVVTNPDMLHKGILPHHTQWVKLFENLQYIVIDEIHHYRGVFGSHLANVIRRLKRICEFYNSNPIFICCSATIANPKELAQYLTGEPTNLVDNNGAPHGQKHFVIYNPPVVNKELGIRRSYIKESQRIAADFITNSLQTIVFARSRMNVEILLTYLKETMRKNKKPASAIRGYRGGYLPLERREIERGLREGSITGVVSTNALELGIDIGQLNASIIAGYPGTISSTLQQTGRAGRRQDTSLAIVVSSSSPLDQFIAKNPGYFFDKSPESSIIDPDNLVILLSHIKCAAFELPFSSQELFGESMQKEGGVEATQEILEYLGESRILHKTGGKWHWMAETYPAESISLRSAAEDNVVIIDTTLPSEKVIGEIDIFAAQLMVHNDAIYLHEGRQFHVDKLDWERKKAYVRQVKSDHYTDAHLKSEIKVIEVFEEKPAANGVVGHGEVVVSSLATMYKKIKFHTQENIGWGKIHLPEIELHTTAFWYGFPDDVVEQLSMNNEKFGDGLKGVSNVLKNIVPLYVMGDRRDFGAAAMVKAPFSGKSSIYIWEQYPGGIGFSKKLYSIFQETSASGLQLIQNCQCEHGCPACVGPTLEVGDLGKESAIEIFEYIIKSQ